MINWTKAVQLACSRIAPSWPLDRAIAVNPAWGWVDTPIRDASARLTWLCGSSLLQPQASAPRLPLCSGLLSGFWNARRIDSLSQICAAYFDQDQALWKAPSRDQGLYAFWRSQSLHNHVFTSLCATLPAGFSQFSHQQATEHILEEFQLPQVEDYLTALLLDLNGWAAWCAYLAWQARLTGAQHDSLEQLLAVLLSWEWCLYRRQAGRGQEWLRSLHKSLQAPPLQPQDWNGLTRREQDFQAGVNRQLTAGPLPSGSLPQLQAVFCIDVRSEIWRRALEACHPSIQTLGFAGFFGLPAEYVPLAGLKARPQLPGLLAPSLQIQDCSPKSQQLSQRRRARLAWEGAWDQLRGQPLSAFHFVESIGLGYAWKLICSAMAWRPGRGDAAGLSSAEQKALKPRLQGLTVPESVTLAGGILKGMGLTDHFAPTILLVGHASSSCNNAHAAALDCGACCGQSGEVNARALAALLNDPEVRQGLTAQAIHIPASTRFLPALHNTTSDEVSMLEDAPADPRVLTWLHQAADRARRERAVALGLTPDSSTGLARALAQRGRDWSQVRPEWGLANNAGLLVAPRARTLSAQLGGRCFLHEYRPEHDPQGEVLAQILGGPVIVAHWINMQYYASVVDPQRWGSGDKVLHNVVGGCIGVLEGGAGDLRIGLPRQSVHDGQNWVHQPLRLSVWIEANPTILQQAVLANPTVLKLVQGEWIHLLHVDPASGLVSEVRGSQGQLFLNPCEPRREEIGSRSSR